jgi:hypothetical protein
MLNQYNDVTVQVDASVLSLDERKAAVKAIEALRAHGHAGIERNLAAAAAIAALKAGLPHGEFDRFCTDELQISSRYRARLLRLDEVRDLAELGPVIQGRGSRSSRLPLFWTRRGDAAPAEVKADRGDAGMGEAANA